MKSLEPVDNKGFRYTHLVGTGGIGSGLFFKLEGNHTLGRNESRLGRLVPYKDYCKLHIISHYIAVLLGSGPEKSFQVFPIGKVGEDEQGRRLIEEMRGAGMNTDSIEVLNDASTLFSVCFQYPDSTGGNITTSNSASGTVTPEDIDYFFNDFKMSGKGEIVLAAPEVPVATRVRLLEWGRMRGSFNVASVLSSEINEFMGQDGFAKTDLLSINIDEARSIAGITDESFNDKYIIDRCTEVISKINPELTLIITRGPLGSCCYSKKYLEHVPSLKTEAAGTGGAGDAFVAGVVAGICCGLPVIKGQDDKYFSETPLMSALELGTLLASMSVTSPDTIHQGADAELLYDYGKQKLAVFSEIFRKIFK